MAVFSVQFNIHFNYRTCSTSAMAAASKAGRGRGLALRNALRLPLMTF
jgi:hypothetical protein